MGKGIGLVNVRSGSVMSGYLVNEQLDTSILSDGWFNTGDLGSFDAQGALHLRGRQAEVVNVSGMKVLPSEVEDVIASLPGVKEVKVYSRKSRAGARCPGRGRRERGNRRFTHQGVLQGTTRLLQTALADHPPRRASALDRGKNRFQPPAVSWDPWPLALPRRTSIK